jgi:single-strand DNA-binding protein
MADMARLTLVGSVARDAENRFTPSGKGLTSFTVAVGVGYGQRRETQFWSCTKWGEQFFEKLSGYLVKGRQVLVEGEPRPPRIYTGSDGKPRVSLELTVTNLVLLGNGGAVAPAAVGGDDDDDDDLV